MTPAKTMAAPAGLPAAAGSPGRGRALALEEFRQLAVPLAVLGIVIALITPLPSFVLDLLIVTDLLMSITVMMVSLYLVRPVEFTSFPTTLLLRSEEHTSELQSLRHLVCRLLLEKTYTSSPGLSD